MLACLLAWIGSDDPQGMLKGKSFLGGSRPGAEDACVYAAASSLPSAVLKAAPAVKGWLNTVGFFAPSLRGSWGGGGASAPTAGGAKKVKEAAATAPAPAAKNSGGDDDDVDSLFGDEEDEEAEKGVAGGGKSRAEQMAAAKSAKDAKKKVDR